MIGIVLAGGQSRRFGSDKALYPLSGIGQTCVQLTVKKLHPFCRTVMVSSNHHNGPVIKHQLHSSGQVIYDEAPYDNHGPLSGIIAVTSHFQGINDYLVLAVDYPLISRMTLNELSEESNVMAATFRQLHFTVAHFTVSHQKVVNWVNQHGWRLGSFMTQCCHCRPLLCNRSSEFINMNYQLGGL